MKFTEKRFVIWLRKNTVQIQSQGNEVEFMLTRNSYYSVVFNNGRVKIRQYLDTKRKKRKQLYSAKVEVANYRYITATLGLTEKIRRKWK